MNFQHALQRLLAVLFVLFAAGASAAPNIVLVVLDDMATAEVDFMPRTTAYLRPNGVEFTNAYVPLSVCGPSRASILTGKYPHNTGVYENISPNGGFDAFHRNGNQSVTLATWLQSRGYFTAFIGKYINGYGYSNLVSPNHVPPGWSAWHGLSSAVRYFGYTLNENGTLVTYGSAVGDYSTDVFGRHALQALDNAQQSGRPLFLMIAPMAPHSDTTLPASDPRFDKPIPAPRHATLFDGVAAPRPASFNESNIDDKPAAIRKLPPLTAADVQFIDESYRMRARSLQAVDELVAAVIERLRAASQLENTYIIFTSDNGYFFGHHRIRDGKGTLYDAPARVPLLIAGPGVVAAARRQELVTNIDLFPTIADLAGVDVPLAVDGRSLKPYLTTTSRSVAGTRKSLLILRSTSGVGMRMPTYRYLETNRTSDGSLLSRELYDIAADPDETRNLIDQVTAESASRLRNLLGSLRKCSGAGCRTLEASIGDSVVQFVGSGAAP
jgi:arylsulfatase A-like enzyme